MGLTFDLEDLPFYTQGELEGFCRERGLPVEGDLRRSLNFFERFVTFTQGGSVRRGYPEDPECSEGSQWEGSQTSSLESGRETDQEGENDRLGTPVDREGPSDRESLAGSSVRSRATSHSLTPDELRDRREERDLKLQLARLAVEERRAEVEKALVQERMAEAERAFARERLALERSLKVLDSPALQVESSGGSNVQCCSKDVPHIPIDLVPRELAKEADFWLRTRGSGVTLGGVPNESGLGVSQPGVVGKACVPGRSQCIGAGKAPHVQSQRRGNGVGLRPRVPELQSQVLEGSMSERQEVSLACAVGPAVQKDPILSLGLGRVAGDSVPPVLVSGSLALQRRRQKSRHRVERGLRAPVENLEGQGSALRAEPPRNDLGETISGLGGIQTLSDGQRSGDLRQPDSCMALGESVSLVGGRCAPQEVLVRQAMIQPQGGDSGLDDQVQGVNSDLMGSTCAPKEVLVRQAVVQPQGSDSGLDCQIQGLGKITAAARVLGGFSALGSALFLAPKNTAAAREPQCALALSTAPLLGWNHRRSPGGAFVSEREVRAVCSAPGALLETKEGAGTLLSCSRGTRASQSAPGAPTGPTLGRNVILTGEGEEDASPSRVGVPEDSSVLPGRAQPHRRLALAPGSLVGPLAGQKSLI
ncbi:hypothetical protein NDU88_006006 [Pleurodeles waltl]|uniref:Uncharacterized protein n=1 Tax=Pleurodeles waltl TaxID=8319 RepID=A0AAV7MC81_PLEWA|nr:hypothetical protein NDU88_006006 [Pleurodeles waltl]